MALGHGEEVHFTHANGAQFGLDPQDAIPIPIAIAIAIGIGIGIAIGIGIGIDTPGKTP